MIILEQGKVKRRGLNELRKKREGNTEKKGSPIIHQYTVRALVPRTKPNFEGTYIVDSE